MPADAAAVFEAMGLSAVPVGGRLEAETERCAGLEALRERLKAFDGEGWICFADRLWLREAGAEIPEDLGPVLSAELYRRSDDISLHVRQRGPGWVASSIAKTGAVKGAGWIITREFLRHDWRTTGKGVRAKYEVCWEPAAEGVLRPTVSRFVGFK